LWSDVPEERKKAVGQGLNDYNLIEVKEGEKKRRIKVDDTNQWHKDELQWLKDEIAKAKVNNERVVVMTHHAPWMKGTSDPQFDESPINCAFSTDLSSLIDKPVTAWIFGHTVRVFLPSFSMRLSLITSFCLFSTIHRIRRLTAYLSFRINWVISCTMKRLDIELTLQLLVNSQTIHYVILIQSLEGNHNLWIT